MNRNQGLRRIVWVLATSFSVAVVSTVAASDEGHAAADQVSEASYRYFLGDNQGVEGILYTHVGDNRGFGPEHDLARDNIAGEFESFGLIVTLEPFTYGGDTYYNVVGTKIGTTFPDQEYIVGGHYDSVNNPGADDNASGTALVLEAARIISQYDSDYTIRFIGFDREEQGLVGSQAYVNAHYLDDIQGMISTDMVAYNSGANRADINGRSASNPIKYALADAVTEYGDGLSYSIGGQADYSDHAPFEWAGFQACILIEDWGNPYYHTQNDNVDMPNYIDYAFAVRMTRSIVGFLVDHAGVLVDIDALAFTYPNGQPELISPAGGTTMRVEVSGVGGAVPQPGTGLLHYDTGSGWQTVAMDVVSENVYEAVFPAAACGDEVSYYVSAETTGGETFTDPRNAPETSYAVIAAYGETVLFEDDFETDQGWSVSGNATAGQWERGVPVGGGDRGDPPTDYDGSGQCYLTGNTDGDSDVDDGYTYLTSPTIDLSDGGAEIHYALWYTNNFGADPNNDLFKTYVSNDNGANWTLAETIGPFTSPGWTEHLFRVGDFVTPTDQVRVRFEASDLNAGSVVEAGIDTFRVSTLQCVPECYGDLDGDNDIDLTDLAQLLANYGTTSGASYEDGDLDGDGDVDLTDLAALLAVYGTPCG
ncbi:MAG: M28 family peptidase [Phycisphaerae bacterium]